MTTPEKQSENCNKMSFAHYYDYVIDGISDQRVKEWLLMSSPVQPLIVVAIYLLTVYSFLPAFMKNRKPYDLKKFITFYNIFQIVACIIVIYGISTSGWTTGYSFSCEPSDFSNDPMALRMLNFMHWTLILKVTEMVETCLFILRKKNNQVSNLHVYHHASTFILGWIFMKYLGGGMATFSVMLNSFIHVLMYTYYLLSGLGPQWQKSLIKWKPRLTIAQMIQFCIMLLQCLLSLNPNCNLNVSKYVLVIYMPNVIVLFYMFGDFYRKNYREKIKKSG